MRYYEIINEDSKKRTIQDKIELLKLYASNTDRSPEERKLYAQKADELERKLLKQQNDDDIVFPEFGKEPLVKRKSYGGFEPYPFKTGSKVDIKA